jgi:hypothetical protein
MQTVENQQQITAAGKSSVELRVLQLSKLHRTLHTSRDMHVRRIPASKTTRAERALESTNTVHHKRHPEIGSKKQ